MSLSHPEVQALAARFVLVRLDSDEHEHAREVMVHRVADLPTVIFFSPTGSRLFELPYDHRFVARNFARSMRRALDALPKSLARERELASAVEAAPDSIEASDALAQFYREGFRFADAEVRERDAYRLAQQQGRDDCDRRLSELLFLQLKLRRFDAAAQAIEAFKQLYPESPHRERVQYYSGLNAFHGTKDLDAAVKIWEEQLNEFPNGAWSGKGRRMLTHGRTMQRDREKLGEAFPKSWGGH